MSVAARVRIVVLVVVGLIAVGSQAGTSIRSTSAVDDILGDANCSGSVDPVDSLVILRGDAGLAVPPCVDLADVQCDGDVDPIDSLQVLRFDAGFSVIQEPGCPPIGEPLGPPPTSLDLIDQAAKNGAIDQETALIYKVYVAFADDRLPGQYRGDDTGGPMDSFIITDVQSQFDTLSPEAQAILGPFLIPPAYKGSWLSPQGPQSASRTEATGPGPVCSELDPDWKWVDASTANVRFWWQSKYPQDEQLAKDIATAMDEKIWPALTGLMGEPLSDEGYECSGGNGRLDVYLALEGGENLTPGYGCEMAPAYIELNRLTPSPRSDLSHEFMHAIQWGYDVKDGCVFDVPPGGYRWLGEATATWAEDFVYPDSNEEWPFAGVVLSHPERPLETYGGQHEYGAYLFFLFLTKVYDSSSFERDVWDKAAEYNSLEALENALPDGFEGRWPRFALCNWNRPPVDCYKQWDDLDQGVADLVKPTVVSLGGEENRSFQLAAGVEHLAASYTDFVFDDDNVHSVVFYNTLADFPHAGVQALVKVGGQWQGADYWNWTHEPTKGFCRDIEGQHIEELVIIISNDDWENKGRLLPLEQPRLEARKAGCTVPDWVGTASGEMTNGTRTFTVEVSGLRFGAPTFGPFGSEYTLLESSSATWRVSGTVPWGEMDCVVNDEVTLPPADGRRGVEERVWGSIDFFDSEANEYGLYILGITHQNLEAICPDDTTVQLEWPGVITDSGYLNGSGEPAKITPEGNLVGEYSWSDPDPQTWKAYNSGHWQWHLEPAPPLGQ